MAITLYLTAEERQILQLLPEALTNGIHVEEEKRIFHDNEHLFRTRWSAVRFESEKLRDIERKSTPVKSQEEIKRLVETADLNDLPHDDLVGLFFIAGPEVLSTTIADGLTHARSAEDLDDIAEFTNVRSILLNAFLPA